MVRPIKKAGSEPQAIMSEGIFLVGTDRGVGKTLIGVGIVALLREMGVDAVMMTPISTGGSLENAGELLDRIGVDVERRLVTPIVFETLASPYVASLVEEASVDLDRVWEAYHELRGQGKFVVVEGAGLMVPITRAYMMADLLKDFDMPSLIIGRTGRGTINHCLLTLRMMWAMGVHPSGFILNGFGQFGDGFAESVNPDALRELADPTPVVATLEWRPEYQDDVLAFVRALKKEQQLISVLKQLAIA